MRSLCLYASTYGSGSARHFSRRSKSSDANRRWIPSTADFSEATLCAITSLCHFSPSAKYYIETCNVTRSSGAVVIKREANNHPQQSKASSESVSAGFIHFLLSQSLSNGNSDSFKYLFASLVESFLRDIGHKLGGVRSMVLRVILVSLRENLNCNTSHSPTRLDSRSFSICLHILASCMTIHSPYESEHDVGSAASDYNGAADHDVSITNTSIRNVTRDLMRSVNGLSSFTDQIISIPELTTWIAAKYHDDMNVISSLMCLLGRIGGAHRTGVLQHGSRKLLANVTTTETIQIMVKYLMFEYNSTYSTEAILSLKLTCAIALWSILSISEQSLAIMKSSVNFDPKLIDQDHSLYRAYGAEYSTLKKAVDIIFKLLC